MKDMYDIAVVGGGLAGLIQAITLAKYGFNTVCIDREDPEKVFQADFDGRTTALSYGSHCLLKAAGLWEDIERFACPINDIHIRDGATPTLLQFLSDEVDGKSFGWIVDNLPLRATLYRRAIEQEGLTLESGQTASDFDFQEDHVAITLDKEKVTVKAKLLIGADGRFSAVRGALGIECKAWDYPQEALVFIAYHDKPHENIAVEHFRDQGPFAILPMVQDEAHPDFHRSSVVWTQHDGHSFIKAPEDIFMAAVQERFGQYFGKVIKTGPRFEYPLKFQHANCYIGQRTALVAEAAHVMHPIAGQGLNMSLRDVAALIELVVDARDKGEDIAGDALLKRYEAWRRMDNRAMGVATDSLNRLFSTSVPPLRFFRNLGLEIVKHLPPAKQFFMRQAMGHLGRLPKLLRGESL